MNYITAEMIEEYERRKVYSIQCADKWLNYWDEPTFGLCKQSGTGAALIIPQGHFEIEVPLKTAFLIQQCIERDPDVLRKFLTFALGDKSTSNNPARTSKRTPIRRVNRTAEVIKFEKTTHDPLLDIDFDDDLPIDKC
ncbi:MAG: hypothetical protein ACI88H_000831 [Cocleimonas sp.]|jgi:hypothetical protein|uniref:hypothetical protein n=1 Tax=Shewanella vesiculosa TaxID=518738 RepID=UPI00384FC61A